MSEASEGLSQAEAARRLAHDGFNELPSPERRGFLRILREVLSEPMFVLLLAAGAIYLVLGDLREAILLLCFANVSASIAVVQEFRSERVLAALRELTTPTALVIRDGEQRRIPGRELVRGDLLLLGEGDRVPADVILVEGHAIEIDESLLTGESVPVGKRVAASADEAWATPGGDDSPCLYSGTLVVRGGGRAVVRASGASSEIGKIGGSLASIVTEPPRLHAQTRHLVRLFGAAAIFVSGLVVTLYWLLRGSFVDALLAGIAVGMSLIPEEFPLVLTVFMVMGAWRISHARVLTRRAAAIESLGAATVLCTDKTGTLTRNHMSVVELWSAGGDALTESWSVRDTGPIAPPAMHVLEAALLASSRDALDPMDRAVHELARACLPDASARLEARPILQEFGVLPELPAVTTICGGDDPARAVAVTKGAPEAVATLCRFTDAERHALAEQVNRIASRGVRVLAVAATTIAAGDAPVSPLDVPFIFVGLAGFVDPLRDGVVEATAACRAAGVRVLMITGDYPATALAIARQAGIDATDVLVGADLAALDDRALAARIRSVSVFARILPQQKLSIVEALKAAGEVVAMTGDGVNDAPSLRAAHIGIAMGRRGTDVAREAASIVLLDDDFRSIVQTIRLGRRIYDNLRKAMGYVVALHVPIAGMAIVPLAFGMPLLLTPMIIAFLEIIIDPVCSVVFEAEPEEPNVMQRPPRDPASAILPPRLLAWFALQGGLAMGFVAVALVLGVVSGLSELEVRSLVFASLVTTNVALVFTNRSFGSSSVESLARPNRLVWFAVAAAGGLLGTVLWWPAARAVFRLGALDLHELSVCLLAGAGLYLAVQWLKGRWEPGLAT